MNLNDARLKIEEALSSAEAELAVLGILVSGEIDIAENELDSGEREPLVILGSLAVSAEGLGEDDIYYLSIEAKVTEGEVDESELDAAIAAYKERVTGLRARLEGQTDIAEALREAGKEIDEELEEQFRKELEKTDKLVKRDLKIAICATVLMLIAAVVFVVVSKIL